MQKQFMDIQRQNELNFMVKIKRDFETMLLKELVLMPTSVDSDMLNVIKYDSLMDSIKSEVKRLQSFESIVHRGRR